MDPIGGDIAGKITASLRDDGELIVFGAMSVVTSNVGIRDIMFRGVKVGGCHHSAQAFHRIYTTHTAGAVGGL